MNNQLLNDKYTSKKTLKYIERNTNIDQDKKCLFDGTNKCIIQPNQILPPKKVSKTNTITGYFRKIIDKFFNINMFVKKLISNEKEGK
jgi:hypothetical protein